MDISQSSMNAETVEIPNIIAQQSLPSSGSPISSDVPLPVEPSISGISNIMPSMESSNLVVPPPNVSETSLLGSEIAPNNEISSILGTHEQAQIQSTAEETASDMPQMENMGYDQAS